MTLRRLTALFVTVLLAAACERGASEASGTAAGSAPAPTIEAAEVIALSEFGPFSSEVTGVAYWAHPAISFNSLALVATEDGLVALNIEDGAEIAHAGGFRAGGVSLIYDRPGPEARGFAIVRDQDASGFRVFAIDNITRQLVAFDTGGYVARGVDAFCAGQQLNAPSRLMLLNGKKLTIVLMKIAEGGVSFEALRTDNLPAPAAGCVADPRQGDLYVALKTGVIAKFSETGRTWEQVAQTGASAPIAIGLSLNGSASGGDDDAACCGQLAVLDGADASVHFFDLDTGATIGAVRLAPSFDVEGVGAATALGLGSGNFGGVYRDGVLALGVDGEAPTLRLSPYNGVMSALSVTLGEPRNPRELSPQPAEDDFTLDVPLPEL